jgi:hypothetical protein
LVIHGRRRIDPNCGRYSWLAPLSQFVSRRLEIRWRLCRSVCRDEKRTRHTHPCKKTHSTRREKERERKKRLDVFFFSSLVGVGGIKVKQIKANSPTQNSSNQFAFSVGWNNNNNNRNGALY